MHATCVCCGNPAAHTLRDEPHCNECHHMWQPLVAAGVDYEDEYEGSWMYMGDENGCAIYKASITRAHISLKREV